MRRYGTVFLLLMICLRQTYSVPIDNNVLGDPRIECSSDFVNVELTTRNSFSGKLYVKGQYANVQCVVDKGGQAKEHLLVNPKGVNVRATVIIQFHPNFVTKVDKAYQINCFYQEAIKIVSAGLDVSMINTDSITNSYSMPTCVYSIRKETLTGSAIKFAKVGDPVLHRWECHSTNGHDKDSAYGMLVHSCYVKDGSGNSELVIDDKGCGLDPYILGHLTYSDDLLTASREAHVFKFADQSVVYFSCQIRLCMKTMDACRGMTPPKCLNLKIKRDLFSRPTPKILHYSSNSSEIEYFDDDNNDDNLLDVQTDNLIVFDSDEDSYLPLQKLDNDEGLNRVCLTIQTTIVLCSAFGVLILSIGVSISIFVLQHRQHSQRSVGRLLTTIKRAS